MKASANWLRELSGLDATAEEMATRLTSAGLEVEGMAPLGAGVVGVIVAEVRATRRHPKADKLTIVEVFDGAGLTEVVCGAPNVPAPGGKVAWARPGATLPGGVTMSAREVRGVLSPGMLCAEDELGLGEGHDGILLLDAEATPGADLAGVLGLPDTILDLNVTPNRPDCLGHFGLARELRALFGEGQGAWVAPSCDLGPVSAAEEVATLASLDLQDRAGCARYTARVIVGVRVGQSPLAVRRRLLALGMRSINSVVDATNLTLLETGHPLHAFDLYRLAGQRIVVRRAGDGEMITTLDGQERRLSGEDIAICDAERPVAIAGVMGGADSEVSATTTRLLLESAWFDPARVRRTGKRLGLHSEAAQRFERGADPRLGLELASARCALRIAEWTSGRVAAGLLDQREEPRMAPARVRLRPHRTVKLLGTSLGRSEQRAILGRLGIECQEHEGELDCLVPTFRPDLTREVDLIEEIARVHGYDHIPATLPARTTAVEDDPDSEGRLGDRVRDAMSGLGFAETISFAFVAPHQLAALDATDWRADPLRLQNPLREEQSVLRTSLLPGLLAALQRNHAHGVADVALFEVGTLFRRRHDDHGDPLPIEIPCLGAISCGRRAGWLKPGEEIDLFDLKGSVEALFARLRVVPSFGPPVAAPWLHPGLGASILVAGQVVGWLGEVHPALRERAGIDAPAFACEVELAAFAAPPPIRVAALPRFPSSTRDVSFFVDVEVAAAAIAAAIGEVSPLIEEVRVREDYRAEGRVPPGQKGMLWSLVLRARDRTLTDEELARDVAAVVARLRERFAVVPRE